MKIDIFQDRKDTLKKRLNDICKYNKTNLIFLSFEPFIKDAIIREKNYAEDILTLKNELGSNVGLLFKRLIQ